MEDFMTRDQLGEKLDRLDPGATFTIEKDVLAQLFEAGALSYASPEILQAIAAFAGEHRCSCSFHEHESDSPSFQKDDIF
jgi:hypothetical protein